MCRSYPGGRAMARTILVVDDQDELRLLISLTLQSLGRIVQASSAQAAREKVLAERPDLIMLDIWLGEGESGLDVCAALKRDPATAAIQVVLLSACGQQSDIAAGLEAGADLYIVKPFSPFELLEAVTGLLASMASAASNS
jgi:DNA-binding response OmpR family regulator